LLCYNETDPKCVSKFLPSIFIMTKFKEVILPRISLTKDQHKLVLFCSWTFIITDYAEKGTPVITFTDESID